MAGINDQSVTVRVPASTSNLGSGFDTLGLALNLHNEITVRRTAVEGLSFHSSAEPAHSEAATAMLKEAAAAFFTAARQSPFGLSMTVRGQIPLARGLGSSSTLILGLLAGLNALARTDWPRSQLLNLVARLEGHPDNASPAIFGGFTVAGFVNGAVTCLRFPVSDRVRFVTAIPDFGVSTSEARRLVPASFSKEDAVHSLNRSALIAAAFSSGEYESLRGLFDDRLHQPHREALVPSLGATIRAGVEAGAIGGWLSGAGSGIICMTLKNWDGIANAMRREMPGAEMVVVRADNEGFNFVARNSGA